MNKYVWAAIGLAATLLLAASAVAGPLARLTPSQVHSRGVYIQYDILTNNINPANGYPVAGGHNRWEWSELEPDYDDHNLFYRVASFVTGEGENGKKAGIGFTTYSGRTGSAPFGGVEALPDWLRHDPVIKMNTIDNQWYVVNFLSSEYQSYYRDFIYDFADWLADPDNAEVLANVGWVEMGVGLDGETQPNDKWGGSAKATDYYYYQDYAPGGENPPGWTSRDWLRFVNWCTDLYYDAFRVRNPSLASIPVYLLNAPEFLGKDTVGNRDAFSDYAAIRGVADGKPGIGLKNNGLLPDRSPAGLYGPLERWGSTVATVTVPIAWETYIGESWGITDTKTVYWTVLAALDKHPDVIAPTRGMLIVSKDNPVPILAYVAVWSWAAPYLGVTPSTTPGIWCALRETESGGEYGNFFFWLYQNDNLSGGRTVALYPGANSGDAWLMSTGKEGRYGRRTDTASGNPYMHFQVLNPSPYYGNPGGLTLTVTVTYLDKGTDQWKLRYDSTTGIKDAPQGPVVKTNTNTWKKATFVLTDARFGHGYTDNGTGGGNGSSAADLTVDCMGDGNEYIHMVEIARRTEGGPTPTPTATATPVETTLRGTVALRRRVPAPDPSWTVTLTVSFGGWQTGATTDSSGVFTITDSRLTPGTYDICVKNSHALSTKTHVTLVAGTNTVYLGELREGDANGDDFVDLYDFGILAGAYMASPLDKRADFNQDGIVDIFDFAALRDSYFAVGECRPSSSPPEDLLSTIVRQE
jgi:hypothetical protein